MKFSCLMKPELPAVVTTERRLGLWNARDKGWRTGMTTNAPYAVIFKAFEIDAFVERRLACVVAAAPSADVYLMVDETNGSLGPIHFDRVIRYREVDVIELGFAPHAQGSLFWYNADYPLYYFQHLQPDYDYIVMIEYDAVANIDLDKMVRECRDNAYDFVGQPITKNLDDYWWTGTMLHFYSRDNVRPYLICAAIFSARAVRYLAETRLRQGSHYELANANGWPIGESFVGTELALGGLRIHHLSAFGGLTRYDWWTPIHESELPDFCNDAFVHPVLVGGPYIKSLFKNTYRSGLVVIAKFALARLARTVRRVTARVTAAPTGSAADRH